MNKTQLFLKKNSSTILTVLGAAGVITTSVLTANATIKALDLVNEEKYKRATLELTPAEIVKVAWKPYIPAVISGLSTIGCIFGANYLNKRQQASLMSAYALLDNSFKEYRKKTKELYPEESHTLEQDILKSKFNDSSIEIGEDKELFFDYQSMRYFESTFEEVKRAEQILNRKLSTDGYACLNDLYDILGLDHVAYGYQLGWSTVIDDRPYAYSELEFDYEKIKLEDGSEDGLECNIMTIAYPPSLQYMC